MREGTFKFKDRKEIAERNLKDRKSKEEDQKKKALKVAERDSNHILVVDSLPPQVTEALMIELFNQYPGFK